VRLGQRDEPLGGVLLGLEHVVEAIAGEQGGSHHAAAAGAVLLGHADQTLEDVGLRALGEQRPQPLGLGHDGRGRSHRDPAGIERHPHRRVGGLLEGLRDSHELASPAGTGCGGPVAHPPDRAQGAGASRGLAAGHGLADHRDLCRPAGGRQPVQLSEQRPEVVAAGPPELARQALQR
jgi:hypothetical protein